MPKWRLTRSNPETPWAGKDSKLPRHPPGHRTTKMTAKLQGKVWYCEEVERTRCNGLTRYIKLNAGSNDALGMTSFLFPAKRKHEKKYTYNLSPATCVISWYRRSDQDSLIASVPVNKKKTENACLPMNKKTSHASGRIWTLNHPPEQTFSCINCTTGARSCTSSHPG